MPATSEKQRRFFGMILGAKRAGKMMGGAAGKAEKSMNMQQVRDFAMKPKKGK